MMIWANMCCYMCGKTEINCDSYFEAINIPGPDMIKCKKCKEFKEKDNG